MLRERGASYVIYKISMSSPTLLAISLLLGLIGLLEADAAVEASRNSVLFTVSRALNFT